MKEISLRENVLDKDRTHLANERTLLAYWRTSLALFILGAFMMKFLEEIYFVASLIAMILGFILFIFGTKRFLAEKRKIEKM